MKYRIEISEESLRIIGLAVEEYMRIRMDQYKFGVYNERSRSVEKMFNLGYQMAFPPFGNRERQHDSWGTCIDLVHAIEHQQWLDAPEGKKEAPGTTYRSHGPVPLGREPYPKIEKVEE